MRSLFLTLAAGMLPTLAITQPSSNTATPIPDVPLDIIYNYCIECHDELTAKGDLNLDVFDVDWSDAHAREHWTEVYSRIDRGKMPPKEEPQPSTREREQLLTWLDQELTANNPIGGAPMRRLNRREIENSLTTIFPIPGFELPPGFPPDNTIHGFDTVSEALVISASHLEAYRDTATLIADYLFPQPKALPEKKKIGFDTGDFAISYSSASVIDGAMRLASTGALNRNGTWLSRFEAEESGTYQVTVELSSKNPPQGNPPELHLQANNLTAKNPSRSLATFTVQPGKPQIFTADVELYQGETLVFAYKNAPYNHGSKPEYTRFLQELFTKEQALAAAWIKLNEAAPTDGVRGGVPRGGTGWERLKKQIAANPNATVSPEAIEELSKKAGSRNIDTGETIVYKFFEEGPNIGIHSSSIEGPFALIEDDAMREQAQAKKRFFDKYAKGKDFYLDAFFEAYLSKLFRRPATEDEVSQYVTIVQAEQEASYTLDEGLHLAIRTSLLSSNFLYKESGHSTQLEPYELASRLSYFLTSHPPDFKLLAAASAGTLNQPEELLAQTKRFLKDSSRTFATDFTSLWLDTHLLDTIMPDPQLLRYYTDNYRRSLKEEVILNFLEILTKNESLDHFINPDFLYTNPTIGWELYELEQFSAVEKIEEKKRNQAKLKRIEIPHDTRYGGLLAMPAIMLATANGVDTQPIIRGVWMLENIIGRPPPEPPKSVPALSPDLAGATTLKERLAAHMADASCASCHEDIDPVGFVFENFDAVGRWRTEYPTAAKKAEPLPVDATGVLPEGTPLNDVTDLKKWLVTNPEHFANCLAEKLMLYGTGREMNYREKKQLEAIVEKNIENGNRFEDLLIALIQSEIFLSR